MNESKEDYHDTDFNIGENTQDYMLNYMTQRSPNGSPNDSEEEPTQVLLDPSQNTMFQPSQQGGYVNYANNPTSYFFNPSTDSFQSLYSAIRQSTNPIDTATTADNPTASTVTNVTIDGLAPPPDLASVVSPTRYHHHHVPNIPTNNRSQHHPELLQNVQEPSDGGSMGEEADSDDSEAIEMTVEEEIQLCLVSDIEWFNHIQEQSCIPTNTSKTPTPRKMNPGLWAMLGKMSLQWEKWGWYRAQRGTKIDPKTNKIKKLNNGDMKGQAVRQILNKRQQLTRPNIPEKYFDNTSTRVNNRTEYWFLSKYEFLKWANSQYKVDLRAREEKLKPQPSDIIRVFGIATSSYARDDITKLTEAKAYKRSDLDGAMPFLDAIFCRWQEKFNDPSFDLFIPARSKHLATINDLNPNSITRINIMRSHTWIKSVYQKVMKEYNYSMSNWKSGTGGGLAPQKILQGIGRKEIVWSIFPITGNMVSATILHTFLCMTRTLGTFLIQ